MSPSETRERLLAAARAHLDEHGLDGLTLRAIARRAGVSHGAPLRHFPGIDHLLAAVAAQGFRHLHDTVAASVGDVPPGGNALDRLAAAAEGYARFALANPGVFELMFRHERHAAQEPELQEAGAAAFLQLVGLVADAQAEGWRPEEAPGTLAALLWASIHGLVSLWIPGTLRSALALAGVTADLDSLIHLMTEWMREPSWVASRPHTTRRRRTK